MQATISGQHVEITDILREYVRPKLARIDRYVGPAIRSHMMLHVTRNRHRVETTVQTKGSQWYAISENNIMYVAIDRVADKLDRQVIKHKEKSSTTIKKKAD